jgi:hypothetical protein
LCVEKFMWANFCLANALENDTALQQPQVGYILPAVPLSEVAQPCDMTGVSYE